MGVDQSGDHVAAGQVERSASVGGGLAPDGNTAMRSPSWSTLVLGLAGTGAVDHGDVRQRQSTPPRPAPNPRERVAPPVTGILERHESRLSGTSDDVPPGVHGSHAWGPRVQAATVSRPWSRPGPGGVLFRQPVPTVRRSSSSREARRYTPIRAESGPPGPRRAPGQQERERRPTEAAGGRLIKGLPRRTRSGPARSGIVACRCGRRMSAGLAEQRDARSDQHRHASDDQALDQPARGGTAATVIPPST